ncbi:MAG: sel1 repeat family protein [Pedosphaera sp.]|nr:sel1 repeat family protein [Pedosphaera sp.]
MPSRTQPSPDREHFTTQHARHEPFRSGDIAQAVISASSRPSSSRSVGAAITMLVVASSAAGLVSCSEREPGATSFMTAPVSDLAEVKPKAEAGDSLAENRLGEIYAEGKQVRQDYPEAIKWYRKAADKGFAKAEYNLGVLYEIGQGVPRDEAEAARWYRKAADQGHSDSQYNLAAMYGLGRGVKRDPKEAFKWYERAAEQGDALACYNLAERYERAKDVGQDLVEAYKWHSLAAERGLKDGAVAKANLARNLNSTQLAEARRRMEEFKSRPKANRPGA